MRILAAAILVGAGLATSPLLAADIFDNTPTQLQPQRGGDSFESAGSPLLEGSTAQGELGSNWYIRGDVGYGPANEATIVPSAGLFPTVGNAPNGDAANPVSVTRGNNKSDLTATFDIGFGYRVNDWLRAEGTWTYSNGPGLATAQTVFCPEAANSVSNYNYVGGVPTAVPYGYAYDFTKCDGRLNARQYNNTVLAMGYLDLGHWGMFSPYIGAGAGINVNTLTGSLNFTQQDTGANYSGATVSGAAPALWAVQSGAVDQGGNPIYVPLQKGNNQSGTPQPIGPANWSRSINTTKYTIAASAAAGVGIQISQSATLDIGYHVTALDLFGGTKSLLQSIKLGVRYTLN